MSPAGLMKHRPADLNKYTKFYEEANFVKKMFIKYVMSLWED